MCKVDGNEQKQTEHRQDARAGRGKPPARMTKRKKNVTQDPRQGKACLCLHWSQGNGGEVSGDGGSGEVQKERKTKRTVRVVVRRASDATLVTAWLFLSWQGRSLLLGEAFQRGRSKGVEGQRRQEPRRVRLVDQENQEPTTSSQSAKAQHGETFRKRKKRRPCIHI